MGVLKATDEEFAAAWRQLEGRAYEVAKQFSMTTPKVYKRRNSVEAKLGISLPSGGHGGSAGRGDAGLPTYDYNPRLKLDGFTGTAVIFSDCHWWPGISETVAYQALLEVIKEIKPKLIVGNGDLLDGAQISRHPPIGWAKTPNLRAELGELGARETGIRHACRRAQFIRTIGNHDIRYDSRLADRAREFADIKGFRLADHLPDWKETTSLWINDRVVIKHRWHGGINAAMNNTLKSGKTMVTGHDHVLLVRPYVDYNGMRWGVQDGTLSDPGGPQFAYAEDNPSQATSGFAVLSFDSSGRVLYPEVCEVRDGVAYFRGQRVCGKRKVAA